METIDIAGTYRAQWGEGPIWWQNRLIYVDIEGRAVIKYDPATKLESSWDVSSTVGRIGTVVPRTTAGPEGPLLVAGDTGIHFFNPETGTTTATGNNCYFRVQVFHNYFSCLIRR